MMDPFAFLFEGILVFLVGLIGLLGNLLSLVVYSRQKVHRIFHNLLFTLSLYDTLYVLCSILLFALPKFSADFDSHYRVHMLPILLPMAHVGLMGSVYCTLAMAIERFLAVSYPFLAVRRVYSTKMFVIPIITATLIYNLPKFFELYVETSDCNNNSNNTTGNITGNIVGNITGNISSGECDPLVSIQPTALRTNPLYIRVYILWLNLIVQILLPFLLLIALNIRTYQRIKEFEASLSSEQRIISLATMSTNTNTVNNATNNRNGVLSLRRREVILAKVSLYIVFVFLVCHFVKLLPNAYEMVHTYLEDYEPGTVPWPPWISRLTNLSHFLLALACSTNFFIYYVKHGQTFRPLLANARPKRRNSMTTEERMQFRTAQIRQSSPQSSDTGLIRMTENNRTRNGHNLVAKINNRSDRNDLAMV